jgi:hypothetical protein
MRSTWKQNWRIPGFFRAAKRSAGRMLLSAPFVLPLYPTDDEVVRAILSCPLHWSGIAHVQTTNTQRSGSSSSALNLTHGSTTTAGNLLVVTVSCYNNATFTLGDTYNNTWASAKRANNSPYIVEIFYAKNCLAGASHQITVTPSIAAYLSLCIEEFSGVDTTAPLDQTNSATTTGANPSSGNVTTAVDGELYVGALNCSGTGTPTVEAGWNSRANLPSSGSLQIIAVETQGDTSTIAAGTYAATWTLASTTYATAIATFKAAAAAAGGLFRQDPMTGLYAGGPFFANPIG